MTADREVAELHSMHVPGAFSAISRATKGALTAVCLLLGSCAQPGAPMPPSLELPRPPSDLRAIRKGDAVTLTWSPPTLTTDRESVRSLGDTKICRSTEADISCGNPVAGVAPPAELPGKTHKAQPKQSTSETFTDTLPTGFLSENPEAEVTYAIEVLNRNGRGAGPANLVHVPAVITLPAPKDLAATLTDDGVMLNWTSTGQPASRTGLQFRYRIYRREETGGGQKNAKDIMAGEIPVEGLGPAHFLDTIEWEKTYAYRVTVLSVGRWRPSDCPRVNTDIATFPDCVNELVIEGDDSPMVRIFAHDIFPPAVPAGLQAVYSGEGQKPFIDLIWAPVTNADLAGYNVYRSEGSGAAVKVNSELVKTPSYRDSAVGSSTTYIYCVSSVDLRGNESARSEAASERVP